jgi:hypothetical protein
MTHFGGQNLEKSLPQHLMILEELLLQAAD